MLDINGIVPLVTSKFAHSASVRTDEEFSTHKKSLRIKAPTWKKVSNGSSVPVDVSAVYVLLRTVSNGFDEKSSPASGIPSTQVMLNVMSAVHPADVGKLVP